MQQNKSPYIPTILDARYSSMSAPSTQDGKWAAAKWAIKKGEITLTVFTNDDNDKATNPNERGMIRATMTPRIFSAFVAAISQAIDAPNDFTFAYKHEEFRFFGAGKRSETRMPVWTLVVKKDNDGRILYMLLDDTKQNRPKIAFYFECPLGGKILTTGGQELDPAEVSKLFALGWVKTTALAITKLSTELFEEAPRKQPQQNSSNNYNNNYNNNQQQQNSSQGYGDYNSKAVAGDDIPF